MKLPAPNLSDILDTERPVPVRLRSSRGEAGGVGLLIPRDQFRYVCEVVEEKQVELGC